MDFVDAYFSREHRFAIGQETGSARFYVSFPVTNGIVDYEEYYEIDATTHAAFLADPDSAIPFVEECRAHQHDELLLQKPGWNRGIPM